MEDLLVKPEHITDEFAIPSLDNLSMVEFTVGNVDLKNRTISNVILCQTGEARGHKQHIEQEFLSDMLDYVNRNMSGQVPANFNHNYDNMGLQLGRFHSIKLSGEKIVGELHIFNAADDSPRMPGMGNWVMKLAQEDSKALACSIRFQPAYHYQYDANNKKVKMKGYDWWEGKFENQDIKKKLFVAFGKLISTDLVAEGAVTDSLYHKLIEMNEEKKQGTQLPEDLISLQNEIKELKAEIITLKAGEKKADESADKSDGSIQALSEKLVKDLQAEVLELKEKVIQLSKDPADVHTSGKTTQEPLITDEKKYSAATQRAIDLYEKRTQTN